MCFEVSRRKAEGVKCCSCEEKRSQPCEKCKTEPRKTVDHLRQHTLDSNLTCMTKRRTFRIHSLLTEIDAREQHFLNQTSRNQHSCPVFMSMNAYTNLHHGKSHSGTVVKRDQWSNFCGSSFSRISVLSMSLTLIITFHLCTVNKTHQPFRTSIYSCLKSGSTSYLK